MKNSSILSSSALFLLGCAPTTFVTQPLVAASEVADLSVDQILARHIAAVGGPAAIRAIENINVQTEIVEPDFTIVADYRGTREGLMRVDIYMNGNVVFTESIDSQGAWQQKGASAEITEMNDNGRAILLRGIESNIFGLYNLAERGHAAEVYGRDVIDGINYYILHVTFADGFEQYYYINSDNWLIEHSRDISALHPDLDQEERPVESLKLNYQWHCGVYQATGTRKVDLTTGEEIQRTQADTITCNSDPATLNIERDAPPRGLSS